jgi:hypothetical protein
MKQIGARVLPALALASWAPIAQAAHIEIQHDPPTCVAADRFVRIVAKATGAQAEGVRGAELQFRAEAEGGWYSIAMTRVSGEWSAVLPRTTRALTRVEYRISMAGPDTGESVSPVFAVSVSADPASCEGAAQLSVTSSIVVRVPAGAAAVPPVPAGFNPAGVVGAAEREPPKSKKGLWVLGGVGVAAGLVGLAAAGSKEPSVKPPDIPDFAFNGTSPNPETTISLSTGRLQVFVLMSREPSEPLDFAWRAEWRQTAGGPVCVSMSGFFNGAQRPPSLLLTGPLAASGACGDRFDVSVAHMTIQVSGKVVWDVTLTLPFRFEP